MRPLVGPDVKVVVYAHRADMDEHEPYRVAWPMVELGFLFRRVGDGAGDGIRTSSVADVRVRRFVCPWWSDYRDAKASWNPGRASSRSM